MDNLIYLERCQILMAVTIDTLEFKVTLCPMRPDSCLLWFRDQCAYRSLFVLDGLLDQGQLAARRRIMAKRFHPDAGGDAHAMQVINEAYEFLTERTPDKH